VIACRPLRRASGGDTCLPEPRELARDSRGIDIRHCLVDMGQRVRRPDLRRRIGQVEPDGACVDLRRIDPQVVAAEFVGAGAQVEFPVVPVTRQPAVGVERALDQRIALVRTAIVAGVNRAVMGEQRDMFAGQLDRDRMARLQPARVDRARPFRRDDRWGFVRHQRLLHAA
jgi:hypothetical protein